MQPAFAAVASAEKAFFDAMTAVALVESFDQPLESSTGQLWSTTRAHRQYERFDEALARLPESVRGVAERHVRKHGDKYEPHRAALEHLGVELAPGRGWTARQVLEEVAQQVHRRVSDKHLALQAWARNARPRQQGLHQGTCPLHLVQGKPAESVTWYDQVLDRLAA